MNLEYVDLFYSHRYDPETPLEETLQALVDIVRQGKALYVGISNWPLEPLKFGYEYLKAHDVPLLIYQGRLNMLDRKPQETGILDCGVLGAHCVHLCRLYRLLSVGSRLIDRPLSEWCASR